MGSEVNPQQSFSRSFVDWYLDDTVPGHLPLAPSIFVGKTYRWIFSPIHESGCEAVIDVISRIILFAVLPVIAVLAALCIIPGLISKLIGGCCAPPPPPINRSNRSPSLAPLQDPDTFGGTVVITPPPADPSPPPPSEAAPLPVSTPAGEPPAAYSDEDRAALRLAETSLRRAQSRLPKDPGQKCTVPIAQSALKILEEDPNVKLILGIPPVKHPEPHDPFHRFLRKYEDITTWIDAIQREHDFAPRMLAEGEISIPGDGNCLFAAFHQHSQMADSLPLKAQGDESLTNSALDAVAIQEKRDTAMQWIQENFQTNVTLQGYLINSLFEHFFAQQFALQDHLEFLSTYSRKARQEIADTANQLDEVSRILERITQAQGNAGVETNIRLVEGLVIAYIDEMRQPQKYGGAAEMYALSCLHQVSVCIHRKLPHQPGEQHSKVDPIPYETMNIGFVEKPTRHFVNIGSHYNTYFPPS